MELNRRTVTLKLQRIDVCDLLIACTAAADSSGANKWNKLHDKLKTILDEFDAAVENERGMKDEKTGLR